MRHINQLLRLAQNSIDVLGAIASFRPSYSFAVSSIQLSPSEDREINPSKQAQNSSANDETRAAKRAFFASLFDLSWRLLGAMLLPLFIGLYIDSKREGSGQGFALAGFLIGMLCGVLVMRQVIKKMSKEL